MPPMNRRELLLGAAGTGLAVAAERLTASPAGGDLIRAENEKPGTSDWMLKNTRVDPKTKYRCPWIEGYCSHTSIRAGEELSIFVSTNPTSPFSLNIYRMGYYGGLGGRPMLSVGPVDGETQEDPAIG